MTQTPGEDHRDMHEANRLSWNAATDAHNSHKLDQAGFLRRGGSTLFPEEIALLGDLRGKRVLHLQCNAGQDTLSIAQLGAEVTGVDISDTAIAFAQDLSRDSGIPGTFVRDDVYDFLAAAAARGEQWDIIFASYGWMLWLSDLSRWVEGASRLLAPGGAFVTVEFHPMLTALGDGWTLAYPSIGGGLTSWDDGIGDYVAGSLLAPSGMAEGVVGFVNPHPSHEFGWSVGDLLSPLLAEGFRIEAYEEYPYSNGCHFVTTLREIGGGRLAPPEGVPPFAMMFGLRAVAPVR